MNAERDHDDDERAHIQTRREPFLTRRDRLVVTSRSRRVGSESIGARHVTPQPRGPMRPTMPRAATLTMIVTTNSTTPRPMSADRCSAAGLAELVGDHGGHGVARDRTRAR